jgi:hypothetical protein
MPAYDIATASDAFTLVPTELGGDPDPSTGSEALELAAQIASALDAARHGHRARPAT